MKIQINWNALGVSAGLACAIHCALLPLFISTLPLFGINILDNIYFEVSMILVALFIGGFTLWHGYKKHHHKLSPLILFIAVIIDNKTFLYRLYILADHPLLNSHHSCILYELEILPPGKTLP